MFFLKKNYFFLLCVFTMFFGVLNGLNSVNWLMMWLSMEITLMAFVPRLILGKGIVESYSMIKYFIFQCLGSTFFILGCLDYFFLYFSILGLMIKLGIFPNHFWVLGVSKGLNWMNFMFLMTIQKVLPIFYLVLFMHYEMYFFYFLLILNSFFGNIYSLNQVDLRFLMVFSSMNHMTWLIFSSLFNLFFFYSYMLGYIILLSFLCYVLNFFNIYYLFQVFYLVNFKVVYILYLLMLIFLSFLGFPPLLGFYMKLFSLFSFLSFFSLSWIILLLLVNLFISFSYVRVFIFLFFNVSRSVLTEDDYKFSSYWLIFSLLTLIFILVM